MTTPLTGARWMRLICFSIGSCCVFLLGTAARAERLRVATYNVENYTLADRMVDGVYRQSYPKPETSKESLREVIRQISADVLVLQEVGGASYLKELQTDLAREGVDYPVAAAVHGADSDRQICVLSKRRVEIVPHTDLDFEYFGTLQRVKRGLLEVRVPIAGRKLTVFGVHLKSRYTDRSDDPASALFRRGEARAVRQRVLELFPEPGSALFLIAGDFNDAPKSKVLGALLRVGSTQISEMLRAADSRGEVWTHFFKKEETYSRVDYVLSSPALVKQVVGGAARVFDGTGVDAASDHRPVVVEIEL